MSAGAGDLSQSFKFKPSWGDFPPTFHVPTNILSNPNYATVTSNSQIIIHHITLYTYIHHITLYTYIHTYIFF